MSEAAANLVVVWVVLLQVRIMAARGRLTDLETKWKSMEASYRMAVDTQKRSMDVETKLTALVSMTTNRFLWGNVLNALQQTITGVEDVQVVRFKGDQVYLQVDGTPNRTNGTLIVQGKAPTAVERISVAIDALDTSAQPGKRVNPFKDRVAQVPYFAESLEKTNGVRLTQRSAPQSGGVAGQQFVMFSLLCNFPEKTR